MNAAIIIQGLFACFSFAFGYFQVPIVKAFIDYVPVNNPYAKSFHGRGVVIVAMAVVVCLITYLVGLINTNTPTREAVRNLLLFPECLFLIHWLVFDVTIGHFVHKDPLFIGTTAKTDKVLRDGFVIKIPFIKRIIKIHGFGEHAGLCKLLIVGVVILVINFFL